MVLTRRPSRSSSDNHWLITGDQLWDLTADHPTQAHFSLSGHRRFLQSAVFTSDCRQLVTVSTDRVILWDLRGRRPKSSQLAGPGPGNWLGATVSPDNRWLAVRHYDVTGKESLVRLWEFKAESPAGSERELRGHEGAITKIRFSPNGRWLATADNSTVRIWDLRAEGPVQSTHILRGHEDYLNWVTWSPNSRWLVTSDRKRALLWDLTTKQPSPLDLECDSLR